MKRRNDFHAECPVPQKALRTVCLEVKSPNLKKAIILDMGTKDVKSTFEDIFYDFMPTIKGDRRAQRSALLLPGTGSNTKGFEKFADLKLSSTFVGNNCMSCRHQGGGHSIKDCTVYMFGDAVIPAMVGADAHCVPVVRLGNGDFEILKSFLMAQGEKGFRPKPGAIFTVCFASYLGRVGTETYCEELEKFSKWAKEFFNVETWPFITPWPAKAPLKFKVNCHRFLVATHALYLGDFKGAKDWKYSACIPLCNFFMEYLKASEGDMIQNLCMQDVCLRDGAGTIVDCGNSVWNGSNLDFSKRLPTEVEEVFITTLLQTLTDHAPRSMAIQTPSNEHLKLGFKGGLNVPLNSESDDVMTVHLIGSSNIRDVYVDAAAAAEKKNMNVTLTYRGGSFTKAVENMNIPSLSSQKDAIVLAYLGNESLVKRKFEKIDGTWHYDTPRFLTDNQIENMINRAVNICGVIRKNFAGWVYLIGPFPRLVRDCCSDKNHHLNPAAPLKSTQDYYDSLNEYLCIHPRLADLKGVEVVNYNDVLANPFTSIALDDGIHLSSIRLKEFAFFIASLGERKQKAHRSLQNRRPSFYTWLAAKRQMEQQAAAAATLPTPPQSRPSSALSSGSSSAPVNSGQSGTANDVATPGTSGTAVTRAAPQIDIPADIEGITAEALQRAVTAALAALTQGNKKGKHGGKQKAKNSTPAASRLRDRSAAAGTERTGPMTSTPRENLSNNDVTMRTAPPGTPQAPTAPPATTAVVADQPVNILKQAFLPPNNTAEENSNAGAGGEEDGDLSSYHDSDEDDDIMDAGTQQQLLDEEDELEANMSAFTNAETEEGRRGGEYPGNEGGAAGDEVSDMEG